jgi:polar amino acid transport system substrate-binding protein
MKLWVRFSFQCLIFLLISGNLAAQALRLNSNDAYPRSAPDKSGFEDKILQEALKSLGLDFERITIPSERALLLANAGEIDGDYVRISGLERNYPNLVMVAEPITTFDFVAYSLTDSGPFDTWESLRDVPIAHITGWKIIEERTKDHPDVSRARDENTLFELLSMGRVRAIIYERLEGRRILQRMGLSSAVQEGAALEQRDMHLYLHKKHLELAGRLSDSLARLRVEGRTAAIVQSILTGTR